MFAVNRKNNNDDIEIINTPNSKLSKFKLLCIVIKKSHKSEIPKNIDNCKRIIDTICCVCKYIKYSQFSNELFIYVLDRCKYICNFCSLNSEQIYSYVHDLDYKSIKKYVTFTPDIFNDIMKTKYTTIPLEDIFSNIDNHIYTDLLSSFVNYILSILKHDPTNKQAFNIIDKLIDDKNFIIKHEKIIMEFIYYMLEYSNINIFKEEKLMIFFKNDRFLKIALKHNNYNIIKIIFENSSLVYVPIYYFNEFLCFLNKYGNTNYILLKIINIVDVISHNFKCKSSNVLDITVNPKNIIKSIKIHNINDIINIKTVNFIYDYSETINDNSETINNDFYKQFILEIKQYFTNGFIPEKSELTSKEWRLIGALLSRIIFCENKLIPLDINPIISYLMIYDSKINFQNFKCMMEYFNESFDLQYIKENYINDNTIAFINGFKKIMTSDINNFYLNGMNYIKFHNFIVGDNYRINDNSIHSFKNNLDVICENDLGNLIKECIIEILENRDIESLKTMLKDLYGTFAISSFYDKKFTIHIVKDNQLTNSILFNCLYIDENDFIKKDKEYIKKKLNEILYNKISRSFWFI